MGLPLNQVPKKMVVIGGGAIGLELGCVWSRLGAEVTIVEFLPEICPHLDPDVAKVARRILEKQGLNFLLSTKVTEAKNAKQEPVYHSKQEDRVANFLRIVFLLQSVVPPVQTDWALETHGVKPMRKDECWWTLHSRPIFLAVRAIGDLILGPMLAHKAEEDGVACAEIIAGQAGHVNYDLVPGVIYVDPEIANIGLSEAQAKEKGISVRTGSFPLAANGQGTCDRVNGWNSQGTS